jgi:hypothetical protein
MLRINADKLALSYVPFPIRVREQKKVDANFQIGSLSPVLPLKRVHFYCYFILSVSCLTYKKVANVNNDKDADKERSMEYDDFPQQCFQFCR